MSKNVFDTDTHRGTDILLGVCFFFALVAIGLAIAINFRPMYYGCINDTMSAKTGLNREQIIENYNALIDYCSPFYFGELVFPSLKSSVSGISHFAEVKVLFNVFYGIGLVSLIIVCIGFASRIKEREIKFLKVCSIVSIVIPAVLVIASIINFNGLFILFHKIAFRNDDWIFDPKQDPVIEILPEKFFMLCLIVIAGVVIAGSCVTMGIYMYKKKKQEQYGSMMPKSKNFYY